MMGDVFDGTATFFIDHARRACGAVQAGQRRSPTRRSSRTPTGNWTAVVMCYLPVGVNTKLVSDADAPKSYEDLL